MSYNSLFGLGTHSADADLQGHWLMQDNAANTTVVDATGNNDGTLIGGDNTADISTTGPGWPSAALDLDGTSDYINVGDVLDLQSDELTLGIKAKPTSTTQTSALLGRDNGTVNTSYTLVQTASRYQFRISADTNDCFAETPIGGPSTSWQDVTGMYDGSRVYIRVDGTTYAGDTNSGNIDSITQSLEIGARDGGTIPFNGDIAHAFIFSRGLTEAEADEAHAGPEPLNLTAPAVTGVYRVGETLSTTNGTWDSQANGVITYTYQWQVADDASGTNAANITGATASTWQLRSAQSGKYVRCVVSASNDGGNDSAEDTGSAWTLVEAGVSPSYNELFGLGNWGSIDPSIQGWWKLDDNAASTQITDYSGKGNHGVMKTGNTSDASVAGPVGWLPSAMDFTTYNGDLPEEIIEGLGTHSMVCWMKTNGTTFTGSIYANSNGRSDDLSITLKDTGSNRGFYLETGGDATNVLVDAFNPTVPEWYSLGYSMDNSALALHAYRAGSLSSTQTGYGQPDGLAPGFVDITLRQQPICNFAIFSRLLSDSEHQESHSGPEPLNLTAPTVSGTHETGQTLTTTSGTWDSQSNGTVTYTYQWQRADDASGTNAADISGATGSTYTLTASDENKYVRATIVASNDGGSDPSEDQSTAWTLVTAGGGGPTFQPAWAMNATVIIQ